MTDTVQRYVFGLYREDLLDYLDRKHQAWMEVLVKILPLKLKSYLTYHFKPVSFIRFARIDSYVSL